jgi:hypothetical protein
MARSFLRVLDEREQQPTGSATVSIQLAPISRLISDTRGEFSVNSQAVPGFNTACYLYSRGWAEFFPSRQQSAWNG